MHARRAGAPAGGGERLRIERTSALDVPSPVRARAVAAPAVVAVLAIASLVAPAAGQARLGGPANADTGPVSLVTEEEAAERSRRAREADAPGDVVDDVVATAADAPGRPGDPVDLAPVRAREARPLGAGRDPVPLDAIGDGDGVAAGSTGDAAPADADAVAGDDALVPPGAVDLARTLGALAVVVVLAFVARAIVRRMAGPLAGGARPSGVLEVLARYPMGRGQAVALLKVGRRVVVVHQAGSSMRTLSEIADPGEVASLIARMEAGSREREALRFRNRLGAFQRELDAGDAASPAGRPARAGARTADAPEASGNGLPGHLEDRTESVEVIDLTRRRRRRAGVAR